MSKYVIKKVMIEFANPKLKAADYILKIHEAISHANINLQSRHGVKLGCPQLINGQVVVNCYIPSNKANTWSIGPHLRGISRYLLKQNRFNSSACVGTRLLTFTEIPTNYLDKTPILDRYELAVTLVLCLYSISDEDLYKIRDLLQQY